MYTLVIFYVKRVIFADLSPNSRGNTFCCFFVEKNYNVICELMMSTYARLIIITALLSGEVNK